MLKLKFNLKLSIIIATICLTSVILGSLYFYSQNLQRKYELSSLWNTYKSKYIDSNGRAIDEQAGGITTSEGQSYSMLRSVWQNDKSTFDNSWTWTKDNLRRKGDALFSWQWGKREDNTYGVLEQSGGQNVAVDADIDIAWSLINASKVWNDSKYLEEAKPIIRDIWGLNVINSGSGKLILASNNLEKQYNKEEIIVNPSYFSTYAMREFAQITPELEWIRLVDDCYFLLNQILDTKYENQDRKTVLPVDWVMVNSNTVKITKIPDKGLSYGYDAVRIPWRVALDWKMFQKPESINYLKRLNFLSNEWQNKNTIYTTYDQTGNITGNYESLLGYATSLAYFDVVNPSAANSIYSEKIAPRLGESMSYYDSNWVAFGLGLYFKEI